MTAKIITVKPILSGPETNYDVKDTDTIADIKQRIQDRTKVPVAQQRLIKGGQLNDTSTVADLGIEDGDILHLVIRGAPVALPYKSSDDVPTEDLPKESPPPTYEDLTEEEMPAETKPAPDISSITVASGSLRFNPKPELTPISEGSDKKFMPFFVTK